MDKSTYLISLLIIGCLLYLYFFRQEEVVPVEIVKEVEDVEEKKETPANIVEVPKKEDGYHTEWNKWGVCSKECGGGIQQRERSYTPAKYGGVDLEDKDNTLESRECNAFNCPENGYHTEWNEWSNCDKDCGGGSQQRERTYTPAKYGGLDLENKDSLMESKYCNEQNCPVDGSFTPWEEWSSCDKPCGGGTMKRERDYISAQFGGVDLSLDKRNNVIETTTCNNHPCPVDGYLTQWNDWSTCDKDCGGGNQQRNRSYNPAKYGGVDLSEAERIKLIENRNCNEQACPQNGYYSAWSAWSSCSKTCGGGIQTRTRTYTPAINGGIDISPLVLSEAINCNSDLCPLPTVPSTKIIDTNFHTYTMLDIKSPNGKYRFVWQPKSYFIDVYNLSDGRWLKSTSIYIQNTANNAALGSYNNNFAAYNSSITTPSIIGTSSSNFQRIAITDDGDVVFENVFGGIVGIAIANGTKINFL
jgi:Thrombospondin type 1 domain